MEKSFADWLAERMRKRGLIQSQVAAYAGVSEGAVSKWLHGTTTPRPESCLKLADLFHEPIGLVYQLAGHPSPDYVPPERQKLSPKQSIMEALAEIPILIPVMDQLASAGEGQIALDYVSLPQTRVTSENMGALQIRGQSMEPEISDGDTVIFDRDLEPRPGDVVLATIGDEVFLKRLEQKSDGRYMLRGNDGKLITADEIHVAGVVLQAVRDLRRG